MTKRKILLTLLDEFAAIERGDMTDSMKLSLQFGIDIAAQVLIKSCVLSIAWRTACRHTIRNSGYVGQTAVDIINNG